MRSERHLAPAGAGLATLLFAAVPASAAEPGLALAGGPAQVMYDSRRDACDPIDVPDVPARVFRDERGELAMFTLHFVNRALRGPDLAHLKIDCSVALASDGSADAGVYDDRRYIAATWTRDGRHVSALVHHEYHADQHGTCKASTSLGCWYNSVLAFESNDAGRSFRMASPPVVASAPFRADQQEGRHRGFFNPSNIVSDGRYAYMFAATTGWRGQADGVCLFRSENPGDAGSWRYWDGRTFSGRYGDPYAREPIAAPTPCAIIEPFLFPVGGVVRDRASGAWIAVWMAAANERQFPVSGFYYATSQNLTTWSLPHLLRAGRTLHDAGCDGPVIAYPTLIDEAATRRNFDDAGDHAWLYYATMTMSECHTGARQLVRERVDIRPSAAIQGAHR